jgi:hypothetical protein
VPPTALKTERRQPGLHRIEARLRVSQHHFGAVEILLRTGASLQQHGGAVEALLRVLHRGLDLRKIGLLQIIIDGEHEIAGLDRVAFLNRKRAHPPHLVGRDKDQIGLDPALIGIRELLAARGGRERDRAEHRHPGKPRDAHRGLQSPAKSRSK